MKKLNLTKKEDDAISNLWGAILMGGLFVSSISFAVSSFDWIFIIAYSIFAIIGVVLCYYFSAKYHISIVRRDN